MGCMCVRIVGSGAQYVATLSHPESRCSRKHVLIFCKYVSLQILIVPLLLLQVCLRRNLDFLGECILYVTCMQVSLPKLL